MPPVPFHITYLTMLLVKESILSSEALAFWASKSLLAQKARIIFLIIVIFFSYWYYPQRYSCNCFHYETLLCIRHFHFTKLIWLKRRTIIATFILSHRLFMRFNMQMQGGFIILRPAFLYRYLSVKLDCFQLVFKSTFWNFSLPLIHIFLIFTHHLGDPQGINIILVDPHMWDILQAYMKLHVDSFAHIDMSQMPLRHQMLDA